MWTYNEVRRGVVEVMENEVVVGRMNSPVEARRFCDAANSIPIPITGVYRLMLWKEEK